MKQIIIFLLLIIAFFIGFGKYQQYKRYNSTKLDYKSNKKIDINFYNKNISINYFNAVEDLNSWVKLQWSANNIDVITPEDDDTETKFAVKMYANKLAKVKYYEAKLEKSAILKEKGLSNKEIKFLEETGIDLKTFEQKKKAESYKDKITNMFDGSKKILFKEKTALIFEVQKLLVKNGFDIAVDGIYRAETSNAIKGFEEKNNLFADGKLDILTLDVLLK